MGLMDQAKSDAHDILSNGEDWAVLLTFVLPKLYLIYTLPFDLNGPGDTISIRGIYSDHHLAVDLQTQKVVNSHTAHITVSEQALTDAGFPVRDDDGEVVVLGQIVTVTDDDGAQRRYRIGQCWPDESIGVINLILEAA